jgi:regulator of sigma E protease
MGVHADSLAKSIGIRDGDKIVSIDGKEVEDFGTIVPEIITTYAKKMQVERDGAKIDINLPDGLIKEFIQNQKR